MTAVGVHFFGGSLYCDVTAHVDPKHVFMLMSSVLEASFVTLGMECGPKTHKFTLCSAGSVQHSLSSDSCQHTFPFIKRKSSNYTAAPTGGHRFITSFMLPLLLQLHTALYMDQNLYKYCLTHSYIYFMYSLLNINILKYHHISVLWGPVMLKRTERPGLTTWPPTTRVLLSTPQHRGRRSVKLLSLLTSFLHCYKMRIDTNSGDCVAELCL